MIIVIVIIVVILILIGVGVYIYSNDKPISQKKTTTDELPIIDDSPAFMWDTNPGAIDDGIKIAPSLRDDLLYYYSGSNPEIYIPYFLASDPPPSLNYSDPSALYSIMKLSIEEYILKYSNCFTMYPELKPLDNTLKNIVLFYKPDFILHKTHDTVNFRNTLEESYIWGIYHRDNKYVYIGAITVKTGQPPIVFKLRLEPNNCVITPSTTTPSLSLSMTLGIEDCIKIYRNCWLKLPELTLADMSTMFSNLYNKSIFYKITRTADNMIKFDSYTNSFMFTIDNRDNRYIYISSIVYNSTNGVIMSQNKYRIEPGVCYFPQV